MADLSPALLEDLRYAVGRYGLSILDVPHDHQGKSIGERLMMLVEDGAAYPGCTFKRTDLRNENASVWELFPVNTATVNAKNDLVDQAARLMGREQELRNGPRPAMVKQLPERRHVAALEQLLAFIDGNGEIPDIDADEWADLELFERAALIIPELRDAEAAAHTRAQLIQELAQGLVPPASEVYVRQALDLDGRLRNADVTLAAYQVTGARLREAVELALEDTRTHFDVAHRLRQVRDDLELIDDAIHWPGPWRTAPRLSVPA